MGRGTVGRGKEYGRVKSGTDKQRGYLSRRGTVKSAENDLKLKINHISDNILLRHTVEQTRAEQSNKKKSRIATTPLFSCCFHVANPFKRFFLIV
jgi:uncharacterized small protein (DUF1192 family)